MARDDRLLLGTTRQGLKDSGLELARTYSWNDCTPSEPKRRVDKDGLHWVDATPFRQFYEFKGAHFEATRYGFPRTRITWRTLEGAEEHQFLIDGPWNKSDRLWESYYPTKVGVIVDDGLRNYLVEAQSFSEFFSGAIVSVVGISPSGCQASFFGVKVDAVTKKNEVRLYAVRVC